MVSDHEAIVVMPGSLLVTFNFKKESIKHWNYIVGDFISRGYFFKETQLLCLISEYSGELLPSGWYYRF